MLTLEEAVAKLDAELADAPLVARGILDITVLWQPKADAIRAAVRDVTLAAVEEVLASPIHSELDRAYWKAEIIRRFGPEKAGE